MMRSNPQLLCFHKHALLLFCLLMFCYAYVHQEPDWNANSRLDLLHALLLQQTFKIDAYHENTGDKSSYGGHYYSDKAPGIVFLAIPAFSASVVLLRAFHISLDSPTGWLVSSWITTVGSVGLITAVGGVAIFAFLCTLVGQKFAFLTTLAVFLGSAPFPYATMLFSHAAVIALICIALWAIGDELLVVTWDGNGSHLALRANAQRDAHRRDACPGDSKAIQKHEIHGASRFAPAGQESQPIEKERIDLAPLRLNRYLLSGFCCGLAIASEYTAALAAGGVLMLVLLTNFKRGLVVGLGAFFPLLLIPIYNWACFGGPLEFGYHHEASLAFQGMNKGLFGVTFPPKATSAHLILFSPQRGLFFWTPFYLMAVLGIRQLWKGSPKLFWVSWAVIVLQVFCISGYYMPSGGAALGPRHLAPMLPFITLCVSLGFRKYPYLGYVFGLCSILLTGLATLINALTREDFSNPLIEYYGPRLFQGEMTYNIGLVLGLPGFLPVALIVAAMTVPYIIVGFRYPGIREHS